MTTPALDPKSPLAPSRWDIPLLGGVLLGGAFLLFYLNYTAWVGPLWDGDAEIGRAHV